MKKYSKFLMLAITASAYSNPFIVPEEKVLTSRLLSHRVMVGLNEGKFFVERKDQTHPLKLAEVFGFPPHLTEEKLKGFLQYGCLLISPAEDKEGVTVKAHMGLLGGSGKDNSVSQTWAAMALGAAASGTLIGGPIGAVAGVATVTVVHGVNIARGAYTTPPKK